MKTKLNLGCGDDIKEGFHNVDCYPYPGVDEIVNLRNCNWQSWTWEDSTFEYVYAADIIEHLSDKIFTMNELHRIVKPGGKIEIIVPTSNSLGAHQDPTHVSYWNRNSFWYYEDGNPYRERFTKSYGITARFKVKEEWIYLSPVIAEGTKLRIILEVIK